MFESDFMSGIMEANRLIQVSCEKIVNSRRERGGARLHRNLMIVHLIRKARSHTMRSTIEYPSYLGYAEPNSSCAYGAPNAYRNDMDCQNYPSCYSEQLSASAATPSYDTYDNMQYGHTELCMELQSEAGRPVPLEPVKVQFAGDEAPMDSGELIELKQSEMGSLYGQAAQSSNTPVMVSTSQYTENFQQLGNISNFWDGVDDSSSNCGYFDDNVAVGNGIAMEENDNLRVRKRKSSPSTSSSMTLSIAGDSDSPKKCCGEKHLSGLITVFNSGLSVVADQIMPQSQSPDILSSTNDQMVSSLIHLACSPLICK